MPSIEHDALVHAPVDSIPGDEKSAAPEEGIALCLSGGGYRAMLFHLGALWRLDQVGVLAGVARISSVSGGSITAGVLGLWMGKRSRDKAYGADFLTDVVGPIRRLASYTIDRSAILRGLLTPGSIGDKVELQYQRHLFGSATLQDLPDHPRFVINATNVQSGSLWRFSKPYMADWRVGRVPNPNVLLAQAVAASSAFPPALSPVELELKPSQFLPGSGADLQYPPYTTQVVLTDGGVYDNLGLETAWKRYRTILVSDGGGRLEAEADPKRDWARHTYRVLNLIDSQVRSLRKRQLIGSFTAPVADTNHRSGTYWGIRTNIADYKQAGYLPCPFERTAELADTPTRLKQLDDKLQERLINWGYAVSDAAIRRHIDPTIPAPASFPYPASMP